MYYRDEPTAFELWTTLVGGLLVGAMLVLSVVGIRSLLKSPGDMNVVEEQNRAFVLNAPARTATATAFAAHTVWAWANLGDRPASPIETGYTTTTPEQRPQLYALLPTQQEKRRRSPRITLESVPGWIVTAGRLLLLVPFLSLMLGVAALAVVSGAMSESLPDHSPGEPEGFALLWSVLFAPALGHAAYEPDPERHAEKTAALGGAPQPEEPQQPAQPQQEQPKLTDLQRRTVEAIKERLALLEPGWHRVEFLTGALSPNGKACLTKLVRAGVLPACGIEVEGREFRLKGGAA